MKKILILLLLIPILNWAQDKDDYKQTFLSLKQTGVEEFHKMFPEYDGRGTIVFILDTGVEIVPGLEKTSTGDVKVIDMQDFTGQGDLNFYEADIDEEDGVYHIANDDKGLSVKSTKNFNAVDDEIFIGVLEETLWTNSSSGANDVNGNGKYDDKFHFIVFNSGKNWVVYFDINADGLLETEKPLQNYKENFDSFQISNEDGLPNFTFGLNIFPDESKITLHFDDGAHGTHCAGISAGNKINDGDLIGVAPGAYIISLKLGNNNFAGGATVSESMKKCYLYADKISKEKELPCIINMSFGIGSEIEGNADMEAFLKELVDNNPYLYICTSNGNEGPGLSTSGLPAASDAIFSSGAILAKEVGNDLYGAPLKEDIILHFSSRGGEVGKPNVVAPGACISTVPNWAGGDRFWGTSMASPYSAGVMSLLLGAAKVEFPDVKIPSKLLYRIISQSAKPMEKYDAVDQGGGYINVMAAWELLKKSIKNGEIKKFETYSITGFAPNLPAGSSPNIYLRNGSYLTGDETFTYRVSRDNFNDINKFYRSYKLVSDKDWLRPVQKNVYIKNNQGTRVNVQFDKSKITAPGLYNGKITAYRSKTNVPEFEMMATVVIPYEFNASNNYKMSWKDVSAEPGIHKRYFINVPAGVSSMNISMSSDDGEYTFVWGHLHDPDGRKQSTIVLNATENENRVDRSFYNIEPGVYELVVVGFYSAKNVSEYNLFVELNGVNMISDVNLTQKMNDVEFMNNFNKPKNYSVTGQMMGYKEDHIIEFNKNDVYEYPFVLRKGEEYKNFDIKISKEDFNKTTDFAIQILNKDRVAISKSGLSYMSTSIGVANRSADDTTYILELRPAFANAPSEMRVFVEETTTFKSKPSLKLNGRNSTNITLYPSVKSIINCGFSNPEVFVPTNANVYGKLFFENNAGNTELEFPLFFKF